MKELSLLAVSGDQPDNFNYTLPFNMVANSLLTRFQVNRQNEFYLVCILLANITLFCCNFFSWL